MASVTLLPRRPVERPGCRAWLDRLRNEQCPYPVVEVAARANESGAAYLKRALAEVTTRRVCVFEPEAFPLTGGIATAERAIGKHRDWLAVAADVLTLTTDTKGFPEGWRFVKVSRDPQVLPRTLVGRPVGFTPLTSMVCDTKALGGAVNLVPDGACDDRFLQDFLVGQALSMRGRIGDAKNCVIALDASGELRSLTESTSAIRRFTDRTWFEMADPVLVAFADAVASQRRPIKAVVRSWGAQVIARARKRKLPVACDVETEVRRAFGGLLGQVMRGRLVKADKAPLGLPECLKGLAAQKYGDYELRQLAAEIQRIAEVAS